MRKERIREIFEGVKAGKLTIEEAMETLKRFPLEDVAFAHIDHHRDLRRGFPEVVERQERLTISGFSKDLNPKGGKIVGAQGCSAWSVTGVPHLRREWSERYL